MNLFEFVFALQYYAMTESCMIEYWHTNMTAKIIRLKILICRYTTNTYDQKSYDPHLLQPIAILHFLSRDKTSV